MNLVERLLGRHHRHAEDRAEEINELLESAAASATLVDEVLKTEKVHSSRMTALIDKFNATEQARLARRA